MCMICGCIIGLAIEYNIVVKKTFIYSSIKIYVLGYLNLLYLPSLVRDGCAVLIFKSNSHLSLLGLIIAIKYSNCCLWWKGEM